MLSFTTSKHNAFCRCGLRIQGDAAATMRHSLSGGALGWVHVKMICAGKSVWLQIPCTLLQNAQLASIAKSTQVMNQNKERCSSLDALLHAQVLCLYTV